MLSLIFFAVLPALTSATCYWQNSTLAPDSPYSIAQDDTACFPSQENSPCCGTGWSCLSDGVCAITQSGSTYYYRGTCTDKTWDSQECPGWCFAENSNTSIPLNKCQRSDGEDWYCCPGDPDCNCDTGKDALKLGASQPVTVTVIGSTSWPGYQSTATPTGAGNIAGAGTSTSQGTGSATPTSANASASNTSSSSSPSSTSQPTHSSTALAAGLGAGIGIAAALGAAGGLFFYLRARKRRSSSSLNNKNNTDRSGPYGYIPSPNSNGGGGSASEMQAQQPLMQQAKGYYATTTDNNPAVSEKDGRQMWSTQELPAHDSGKGEKRAMQAAPSEAVEMDGTTAGDLTPVPGRVELA